MEETDHNTRSQENPDKENTGADHDHDLGQGGRSQAAALRSFECTFCKRGFSSAQALGGHMNIHRKDKAKLKHYSSSSFSSSSSHYYSSLEIPRTAPSLAPSIIEHKYRTSTTKWPWSIRYKGSDHKETDVRDRSSTKTHHHHHHHHHHHLDGEIQLLPLFVDKLSRKDQRRPPRISSVPDGRRDKGFLSLSSSSGLDLELRLGSDPAGESPAGEDFQRFFSI